MGNNRIIIGYGVAFFGFISFLVIVGLVLKFQTDKTKKETENITMESPFSGRYNPRTSNGSGYEIVKTSNTTLNSEGLIQKLPIKTNTFEATYDPTTNEFIVFSNDPSKAEEEFNKYLAKEKLMTNGKNGKVSKITYIKKVSVSPIQNNNSIGVSGTPRTGGVRTIDPRTGKPLIGINRGTSGTTNTNATPGIVSNTQNQNDGSFRGTTGLPNSGGISVTPSNGNNTTPEYEGYESEDQKRIKDKFLKIFSNVVGKMNQNSSQSQTIVNNNSQSNDKESGSTEKEPLTSEKEDIPVSSTSTNNVADWAAKINGVLQVGYVWNNYLNRNITPITNGNYTTQYREGRDQGTGRTGLYWCTNLVIDSYQLSGIKGLGAEHQGVVNMRNYWKNAPAPYLYVEYDKADHIQSLSKVSPGCAIFFETVAGVHTGKEHVAIVKSISMDTSKNGLMESYDANTTSRVVKYPIKNGEVKNVPYPLRGFGCLQNSTKVTSVPVPTTTQSSSSQARTQEEAHSLNFLKSCPSDVSQNRTSVQGPPTLTADRLKLILRSMNSPAEAEAQAIYDLGIKYNINPAILMAFFIQESSAGTCKPTCRSIKNKSIGNIRCSQNWTDEGGKCDVGSGNGSFRMYNSWAAGAEDFYKLIRYKYVDQWKLEYVETVIPKYAPSNENNTCGYIKFTVDRIKNSFSSYIK